VVTVTPVGDLGATAVFTLAADDDGTTFECLLTVNGEPGSWTACTSPVTYTDLAPAAYILSVRGTNREGLVSEIVSQTWTVLPDTTSPVVKIDLESVLGSTATFEFSADEDGVTFECTLTKDGDTEAAVVEENCSSPKEYTDLGPGTYVFSVIGIDAAGNPSEAVESQPWTVEAPDDTTAPEVKIDGVVVAGTTATVTFSANEDATFQCQLVKGKRVVSAWATCTSPTAFTGLTPATYTVSVRATDAAGNTSDVVTETFVVTKAPGKPKGK
jgi:predicted phage tail protein